MRLKGRPESNNFEDLRDQSYDPLSSQKEKASSSQQLTDKDSALDAEYRKRGSAGTKVASQKLKNLQDSHKPVPIDRTMKAPEFTKGFQTNAAVTKNNLKK